MPYPYVRTSVWGGTANDRSLTGAMNAVFLGITSTHIADTLYTQNLASFEKANKAGIPARKFTDTDGKTVYEIHFSFGPDNNALGGILDDSYLINCLNAQLLTPVLKSDLPSLNLKLNAAKEVIKKNKVNSNLDFLKVFTRSINLYPLFNYNKDFEGLKDQNTEQFKVTIEKSLDDYLAGTRDNAARTKYFAEVNDALMVLKGKMDPGDKMAKNQFLYEFNQKIGTIGLPPKTTIDSNLISEEASATGAKGFVEERYVDEMVRVKNSMDGKGASGPIGKLLYTYNFVLFNCSHAVKSLHVKSANDQEIRNELAHTIGWNDMPKGNKNDGFFTKVKNYLSAALEFVMARAVETPVNFAVNLSNANTVAKSLNNAPAQKPKPNSAAKIVPTSKPELKPRLSNLPHHLSLKMSHVGDVSLKSLVEKSERAKISTKIIIDKITSKPIAAIFYGDGLNKNVPVATVDLKPNASNTINMQFGDLPLDQHQILALLSVIKDAGINKGAKEPVVFTIGFSDKDAVPDAHTLQKDIQKVFGADASVKMLADDKTGVQQKADTQQKAGRLEM